MTKRTCDIDGCEQVHRARGLCQKHYKRAGHSPRTKYDATCTVCGTKFRGERKTAKFCTDACKGDAYRTRCKLPASHPVMVLIEAAASAEREAAEATASPTSSPLATGALQTSATCC